MSRKKIAFEKPVNDRVKAEPMKIWFSETGLLCMVYKLKTHDDRLPTGDFVISVRVERNNPLYRVRMNDALVEGILPFPKYSAQIFNADTLDFRGPDEWFINAIYPHDLEGAYREAEHMAAEIDRVIEVEPTA